MFTGRLSEECPGLAVLLGRYFDPTTVEMLSEDYFAAVGRGGNQEDGVIREEGVSFNPRLARIITVLLRDGGVRDSWMLRVAVYGAVSSAGGSLKGIDARLASEVALLMREPCAGPPWYKTIALTYLLDRVRHLHMTTLTGAVREEILRSVERSPIVSGEAEGDPILVKVRHAISLQRKLVS